MYVSLKEAGGIYFISLPSCSDFVKIGYAVNFARRFQDIQVSSPHSLSVELIFPVATFENTKLSSVEKVFHDKFFSYRYRGEWFVRSGGLASFIAERQESEPDSSTIYEARDSDDMCFGWDYSGIDGVQIEIKGFGTSMPLSNKENEVLELMCQAMSNQDIAEKLSVSSETIKSHVSSVLSKTNSKNRLDCAVKAIRAGY